MLRRSFIAGAPALCLFCTTSLAQQLSLGGRTFSSRTEFLESGRRCGTPEPTLQARRALGTAARVARGRNFTVNSALVPVHFHVIHAGDRAKVREDHLDAQIEVLNNAFAAANISFVKKTVAFHNSPAWVNVEPESNPFATSAEQEMKVSLGREVLHALNFYTVDCSLLGWATFPWELAIRPEMDGVVVRFDSLPGVDGSALPYNQGQTATHEVGHWLGLFHTFQGGCEAPGDMVEDTPAEATPGGACSVPRDSCPAISGSDPLSNFMNYSDDACMTEFSVEQISRIRSFIPLFRPRLQLQGRGTGAQASARESVRNQILRELQIQ